MKTQMQPLVDSFGPIQLPADQYLHPSAPTEWWWHTGTLTAGNRVFGFEINAAGFGQLQFSQVMLTDVANRTHYRETKDYKFNPAWAQSDPKKDWYVDLGSNVTMQAPQSGPTQNMKIHAGLKDDTTGKDVTFDLTLSQQGPPMLIWATGIQPSQPGGLATNNCYYSLTRLQASGSISIEGTPTPVQGVTWMDHEYGFFGTASQPVDWILQDMQLNNGVTISNYTVLTPDMPPILMNQPTASQATVQFPDGSTYYVRTFFTPRGGTWTSTETKKLYYMQFQVDIPSFNASIMVTSLLEDQEFVSAIKIGPIPILILAEVYEGVAAATGQFLGQNVEGTAWIEQKPA